MVKRMRGRRWWALAAIGLVINAAVVIGVATAGADTSSGTMPGADTGQSNAKNLGLPAVADTYVAQGSPAATFGGAAKLQAGEAYLRFEVLSPPAGVRITAAKLTLTFRGTAARPATLDLYTVTGTWSETTTYASKPVLGAKVATATVGTGTTLTFDVSATVTKAGSYSFAVVNPGTQVAVFDSREVATTGPRLALTYSTSTP